jgi:hypothetical protein
MPDALRAKIANEQIQFSDEGMQVVVRRHGKGPGFSGSATGKFSGAFVITDRRIAASISNTVMVDASYDAGNVRGAEASITEDGLHVKIDASVRPGFTGEIDMHFKKQFDAEQLGRFPRRTIVFSFPPELVPKIFGVPG